jgi:hypothetical protein
MVVPTCCIFSTRRWKKSEETELPSSLWAQCVLCAWWLLGLSVEVECANVVGVWISKHNDDKNVRTNFEAMVATINVWVGLGVGAYDLGLVDCSGKDWGGRVGCLCWSWEGIRAEPT